MCFQDWHCGVLSGDGSSSGSLTRNQLKRGVEPTGPKLYEWRQITVKVKRAKKSSPHRAGSGLAAARTGREEERLDQRRHAAIPKRGVDDDLIIAV
mmetsp:Transcript_12701/g.25626  ORF Transcript_12701/g.25626 Transcript_12701/m.25626 type:complete len:96 (-) Transcript_12701:52-339(-)